MSFGAFRRPMAADISDPVLVPSRDFVRSFGRDEWVEALFLRADYQRVARRALLRIKEV
jgi:hypothetical protein